jgi:hypothetical protein
MDNPDCRFCAVAHDPMRNCDVASLISRIISLKQMLFKANQGREIAQSQVSRLEYPDRTGG